MKPLRSLWPLFNALMGPPGSYGRRWLALLPLLGLLFPLAAIAVWLYYPPLLPEPFGDLRARFEEAQANRAWIDAGSPMQDFAVRFPKAAASDAALRVEVLSGKLGIDLAPPGGPRPADADRASFERVESQLGAYVHAQLGKVSTDVDNPPAEVARFLESYAVVTAAIELEATQGGEVLWQTDIDGRAANNPFPFLRGQRPLQWVLLADAFQKIRVHDQRGAERAFEASWTLGSAIRRRSELISQMIACALDVDLVAALRRANHPVEAWQDRLKTLNHRQAALQSLQFEALVFSRLTERLVTAEEPPREGDTILQRSWVRLCGANMSLLSAQTVVRLRGMADPCRPDLAGMGKEIRDERVPSWNVLGRIAMPSWRELWRTAMRADLEGELTGRVLLARSLRTGPEEAWPASALAPFPSSVCSSLVWLPALEKKNVLSIRPSREPAGEEQAKGGLPLAVRISAN
jgi:hypothetical protein